MEKKNAQAVVPDDELLALLEGARNREPAAMLELIELYKEDMRRMCRYIRLPREDAMGEIIVEFLAFIQNEAAACPDADRLREGECEKRQTWTAHQELLRE